jgi:hypothetical protein
VKEADTGLMFMVVDDANLGNSAGYEPYAAGSAASVPWAGVTGKPSTFAPSAHGHDDATPSAAGFMPGADKTKLDALPTGATLTANLAAKSDLNLALSEQTASYTLVLADAGKDVSINSASAANLTVPPNSEVAFSVGTQIVLEQLGAGQITVVAGSGVTINARGAALKLAGQYAVALLIKRATDTWTLSGDITA